MGAVITFGNRVIILDFTKEKVNARNSAKSEMIEVDNTISKVLWTRCFMKSQDHKRNKNIIFHNNTSSIKLELMVKQA